MPLIACPECGRGVSETAASCPNCGHLLRTAALPEAPAAEQAGGKRGWGFEWRSKAEFLGWPLVHVAVGRDPKTRKLRVARGIIAVGQVGFGFVTIAQLGVRFGLGQLATGATAIGQLAFGTYVLAQIGLGKHVWSPRVRDPQAVEHFTALWNSMKSLLGLS